MFKVENMPYFLFGYTVLIVILCVFVIIRQYKFEKSFAHGKVKVISRIEIDAITGAEIVVMSIVNRSFNSVEIKGFGYKHYNQDYDFMHNYRLEHGIKLEEKVYLAARETLEARISLDNLKVKLNSKRIRKFRAYVIDVYGNYIITSAKYVEKYIELFFRNVEFVERVSKMPPEKQQKYFVKQQNLQKRANDIMNKSIITKLKYADQEGERIISNVVKEDVVPKNVVEEVVDDVKEEIVPEEKIEETVQEEKVEEKEEE